MTPKFSVILPVCHGGKFLKQALNSLVAVLPPSGGVEIIIAGKREMINDAASKTNEAGWQFVPCDGNRAQILNVACNTAHGTFLVFSDDDCVFPSDWLLNIERALADKPDISVLGGLDILAARSSGFDLALDVVLNSWLGTGGTRTNHRLKAGRYYPKLWNMIVSADVAKGIAMEKGWLFDPSLPVHEDVDLINRIVLKGGKVSYAPSVSVWHSRDTDFKSYFFRNMAMANMCRKRNIHRVSHVILVAVIFGIPILGIVSITIPMMKEALAWAAGLYAVSLVLTGIKGACDKKRFALLGFIPILLISLHAARAFGYVFPFNFSGGRTP